MNMPESASMLRKHFESEVYSKLKEAEREAELTEQRYSSKDVLRAMKEAVGGGIKNGCLPNA